MSSLGERISNANRAVSVLPGVFPGYPDPSTRTGWADLPVAILVADLTGREDVEYTAMINSSMICVDEAELAVAQEVDHRRRWLLGLEFANGLADLDVTGVAGPAEVAAFARADLILITTTACFEGATADEVAALVMVSNDRARWLENNT